MLRSHGLKWSPLEHVEEPRNAFISFAVISNDPGIDVRHARSRSDARRLTQDTQGPSSQAIKSPKKRSKCWTSFGFLSVWQCLMCFVSHKVEFWRKTSQIEPWTNLLLAQAKPSSAAAPPRSARFDAVMHTHHHLHSQVRSRVCPMTYLYD